MGKVMGCHPLSHDGSGNGEIHGIGELDRSPDRNVGILGIGPEGAGIYDPVPHLHFIDIAADPGNEARSLGARDVGQVHLVDAAALVDIAKVYTDRGQFDLGLTWPGGRDS